jgi:hypothetical protein
MQTECIASFEIALDSFSKVHNYLCSARCRDDAPLPRIETLCNLPLIIYSREYVLQRIQSEFLGQPEWIMRANVWCGISERRALFINVHSFDCDGANFARLARIKIGKHENAISCTLFCFNIRIKINFASLFKKDIF